MINKMEINMRLKKLSRECSDILYGAVNTNFAKRIFLH